MPTAAEIGRDAAFRHQQMRQMRQFWDCPDEGWFWRNKAKTRCAALDEDEHMFGLLPHEAAERGELRKLLARPSADG